MDNGESSTNTDKEDDDKQDVFIVSIKYLKLDEFLKIFEATTWETPESVRLSLEDDVGITVYNYAQGKGGVCK